MKNDRYESGNQKKGTEELKKTRTEQRINKTYEGNEAKAAAKRKNARRKKLSWQSNTHICITREDEQKSRAKNRAKKTPKVAVTPLKKALTLNSKKKKKSGLNRPEGGGGGGTRSRKAKCDGVLA